jgi:hypothetical protein
MSYFDLKANRAAKREEEANAKIAAQQAADWQFRSMAADDEKGMADIRVTVEAPVAEKEFPGLTRKSPMTATTGAARFAVTDDDNYA